MHLPSNLAQDKQADLQGQELYIYHRGGGGDIEEQPKGVENSGSSWNCNSYYIYCTIIVIGYVEWTEP
jgi:hypothetical protein